MQPFGLKCIVRFEKVFRKENGKVVLDDNKNPIYDIDQFGKVLSSGIPGIKKGMTIIAAFRGGMPVQKLEDKKSVTVIFEESDVYGIE
jgi:hypothetical protein